MHPVFSFIISRVCAPMILLPKHSGCLEDWAHYEHVLGHKWGCTCTLAGSAPAGYDITQVRAYKKKILFAVTRPRKMAHNQKSLLVFMKKDFFLFHPLRFFFSISSVFPFKNAWECALVNRGATERK